MAATLVDSNILIDLLDANTPWRDWSRMHLIAAGSLGEVIFNIVIASEVSYSFSSEEGYRSFFDRTPLSFEDIPLECALMAGWAHRAYRARGGAREKMLPDLLIGAHAAVRGHAILTRDPAGYRTYFPGVEIIAPDTHP